MTKPKKKQILVSSHPPIVASWKMHFASLLCSHRQHQQLTTTIRLQRTWRLWHDGKEPSHRGKSLRKSI